MSTKTHRLGLDFLSLKRDEILYESNGFITPISGSIFIYEVKKDITISLEVISTEDTDDGGIIYTTLKLKSISKPLEEKEIKDFFYLKWCN